MVWLQLYVNHNVDTVKKFQKIMRTTKKVLNLIKRKKISKVKLAEQLGITRPTLDGRLSGSSKWKVLEINYINLI
jgi:DNA-binding Xre family transcriptional regulator